MPARHGFGVLPGLKLLVSLPLPKDCLVPGLKVPIDLIIQGGLLGQGYISVRYGVVCADNSLGEIGAPAV
jgi:hypothetical protein